MLSRTAVTSCRVLRCTYHFTLDCIVERNPGLPQLRSKWRAKLLLEAPDQRVAKRDESAVTQRCRHRIGKMTSEDLRVLDLDQNVTTCHLPTRNNASSLARRPATEYR